MLFSTDREKFPRSQLHSESEQNGERNLRTGTDSFLPITYTRLQNCFVLKNRCLDTATSVSVLRGVYYPEYVFSVFVFSSYIVFSVLRGGVLLSARRALSARRIFCPRGGSFVREEENRRGDRVVEQAERMQHKRQVS